MVRVSGSSADPSRYEPREHAPPPWPIEFNDFVMGVRRGQALIREGEKLVLDGHYGVVFADPEESILKHYLVKQAESDRFRKSLESIRHVPARSTDGEPVRLMANAEREEDLQLAVRDGADGIGLYRSEFLFLRGRAPDEETQLAQYRAALEALDGRPLVIRTLDLRMYEMRVSNIEVVRTFDPECPRILMDEHLLRWIGEFARRIGQRCSTRFYAGLALLTAAYLDELRDLLAELTDDPRPTPEEIEERMKPKLSMPVAGPESFVPGAAPSW